MRRISGTTVAVAALFALAACSSAEPAATPAATTVAPSSAPTPTSSPSAVPDGKYTQTWKPHYDKTSCRDFQQLMTKHERWVAAADMLSAARSDAGIVDALPSDSAVTEFAVGIDTVCTANQKLTIAEVAAGLYLG